VHERVHEAWQLPRSIATQLRRALSLPLEVDELASFGQSGLLEAARRYEPARGIPFTAFARFRIRGAILDGIRQSAHLPRRLHQRLRAAECADTYSEVANVTDESGDREQALREHLAGMATAMATGMLFDAGHDDEGNRVALDQTTSTEERLLRAERLALVRAAVERLPPSEAHVIRRFYFEERRLEDLAAELGSSKPSMSRLHTRAVRRLSHLLAAPAPLRS